MELGIGLAFYIVCLPCHAVQLPPRRRSYVYILFVYLYVRIYLYVYVCVCVLSLPRFGEIK